APRAQPLARSLREVEIVAGETSPDKVVRLPLPPAAARARRAARAGVPDSIAPPSEGDGRTT
ncbi:MAG TPA: hypothetical protein PLB02_11740, partial [Thermoanaerobaculia bacterium]|nr:hypothetical protein [Thermoanaerobaculia bacterium]